MLSSSHMGRKKLRNVNAVSHTLAHINIDSLGIVCTHRLYILQSTDTWTSAGRRGGGGGKRGAVVIWALRTTFHRNDQKYS